MDAIVISKVRIDTAGRLRVVPASNPSQMFRFIYRAAMEVDWDEEERAFYTPVPRELSYADWCAKVITAVQSEMGVSLELEDTTVWENVSPAVKEAIRERVGSQG
jgi:hypothetical protein